MDDSTEQLRKFFERARKAQKAVNEAIAKATAEADPEQEGSGDNE